jgi:hypothetical protein
MFNGAYDEYPAWKRTAMQYVAVPDIIDDVKLNSLKEKLGERPKKLVRTITALTPQPLDSLFKILDREYGEPIVIVESQRRRLRNLTTPKMSYEELRDFSLAVNEAVNCLVAAGCRIEYDQDTYHAVLSKTPNAWSINFLDHTPRENRNVIKLAAYLESKLETRRDLELARREEPKQESKNDRKQPWTTRGKRPTFPGRAEN